MIKEERKGKERKGKERKRKGAERVEDKKRMFNLSLLFKVD
jgi:hypothetical protein